MVDKQTGSIFKTKNFERFKFNDFNREIKEAHVKWLMEQMQKYGFIKGKQITCNEKYEIIDGHHRFVAAKRLNIPFEVQVIRGANEELLQKSNVGQLNWNKHNFTNYWAAKGNPHYIALRDFMEKYPQFHITQCLVFLANEPNAHPKTKDFQEGEFKIKSVAKAEEYANKVLKCMEIHPKANQSKFVSALICCETRCKQFKFKEFIDKLQKFPDMITPSITTASYLQKFEALYNYHRAKKNFVRLCDLSSDYEK
jgi:ParB-like nuclease domain